MRLAAAEGNDREAFGPGAARMPTRVRRQRKSATHSCRLENASAMCSSAVEDVGIAGRLDRTTASGTRLARGPRMVHLLATLALLFSLADHWTTYVCLRAAVAGWEVSEANPLADWLFRRLGLAEGLWLDTVVTVLVLAFVVRTPRIARPLKIGALSMLVVTTGWAVANNLQAVARLGLSLTGAAQ